MKYFIIVMLLLTGCKSLKYIDDITYISPGAGNNPDYFILINGKPCKDINGEIGLCSVKLPSFQPVEFKLIPEQYPYNLDFRCGNSGGVIFRKEIDVLKNTNIMFYLPVESILDNSYLNCIGNIIPLDGRSKNKDDISAFFEIRIRFYSRSYEPPEQIYTIDYKKKKYLVFGHYAYKAKIKIKDRWYYLDKQPAFQYYTDIDFAIVETHNMRHSYYGELKDGK